MGRLDGKVAIITGGARGSGEETARRFVSEGARVVIADVRDEQGTIAAERIGEAARYHHCDVSDEHDWQTLIAYTLGEFERLDVLVNNAGMSRLSSIQDTSVDLFLQIVKVNQLGTFLGIRSSIDPMREAGGGSIINISSIAGHFVAPRVSAYAASKFAIRGLTKVAALELSRYGIRVNAICPRGGNPEMILEALPPDLLEAYASRLGSAGAEATTGQAATPSMMESVASTALFLASDDSIGYNGADFMLDDGATCGDANMGGFDG